MPEEQEKYEAEGLDELISKPMHPEATSSATVRVSVEGFEWLFTLRSFGTERQAPPDLMARMRWANEQFIKMGAKPIFGKNGPPRQQAASTPAPAPAPADAVKPPKPKELLCPEHQVIATLKTGKDGAQWYSHKQGDGWCNAKETK